jgi:hypothetical protein
MALGLKFIAGEEIPLTDIEALPMNGKLSHPRIGAAAAWSQHTNSSSGAWISWT